jgi:serine/threonine protein kinase
MKTGSKDWRYGFRMERHDAVEVETEEEVVRVLSGALWRLAVVHAIGVTHGDVKPSNLLQHGEDVLLCDFGHSVMGDAEGLDGGTEAFRIVPRLFKKCKYQCDLEGLYWTAVVLWRRARGHHGRALGDDKRREQFGVLHFPDANEHLCPENRVLREFLCGQAQARELVDPNAILASVDAESAEEWKSKVCRVIKEKKLPPCPEAILDWFAKRQK